MSSLCGGWANAYPLSAFGPLFWHVKGGHLHFPHCHKRKLCYNREHAAGYAETKKPKKRGLEVDTVGM